MASRQLNIRDFLAKPHQARPHDIRSVANGAIIIDSSLELDT